MNYIIFDLEWNQSNCPEGEIKEIPFEIIEIGAVKLNSEKQIVDRFNELIHPRIQGNAQNNRKSPPSPDERTGKWGRICPCGKAVFNMVRR